MKTTCPKATFTSAHAGTQATFDGSGSAPSLAGRHIARWMWAFGDGTKLTTSTPQATHAYPASPPTPRAYQVTLRVADSAGALSAPVSLTVRGTATTFSFSRTASKIKVSGLVSPNRAGEHVDITVSRKNGRVFHVLARHVVVLTAISRFKTSFSRPASGTCRIQARFPGDGSHLASESSRTFACAQAHG